jgi:L-aspartate oxidase
MWRFVGIERSEKWMDDALKRIKYWSKYVLNTGFVTPDAWELQNMLITATCIVTSALYRKESRGVHYRLDFPRSDRRWRLHLMIQHY